MAQGGHPENDEPLLLPILAPTFKADGPALYDAWRATHGPAVTVRLPSGVQAWLVLSHDLARELLADERLSKRPVEDPGAPANRSRHPLFDNLLWMDGPQHAALRAALGGAFSPRRVAGLRPRIAALACALLDEMARHDGADLMQAYATPLPFQVICELVGIPADDRAPLQHDLRELESAEMERPQHVDVVAQSISERLERLARHKQRAPADDVYTALVAAAARGAFSLERLPAFAFLLLAAGHETTANLIGNAVLCLLHAPQAWQALRDDPRQAGGIVEEVLRLESPLETATVRHARVDIEIGGALIRAGDTVFVGLGAANRDPARFASPHELRIGREAAASHLAFGHGLHTCLGAGLARLEGSVALSLLAARFPELRLAPGDAAWRWKPGLITRGLDRLLVEWGQLVG